MDKVLVKAINLIIVAIFWDAADNLVSKMVSSTKEHQEHFQLITKLKQRDTKFISMVLRESLTLLV